MKWLEPLFFRTWWSWDRDRGLWYSPVYRGFNLFEAAAWTVCAAMVPARWRRNRNSGYEVAYAAAFFLFGLTDLAESCTQTSWLIWLKAINLAALLALRRMVLRRRYPASRTL